MMNVLMVFSSRHLQEDLDVIREQLERRGGIVDEASNAQAAVSRLRQRRYGLIIVGTALADNRQAPIAEDGGLVFCSLARHMTQSPILVLAPTVTNHLIAACNTVPAPAPALFADRAALVIDASGRLPVSGGAPDWQLEITIFAEDKGWRYEMRGPDFDFVKRGPLVVQRSAWMCWSGLHYSPDHWYGDFAKVGKSIRFCLWEENQAFKAHLEAATVQAKSTAQQLGLDLDTIKVESRVNFVVTKTYYRLALEAIFNPMLPEEPWLANAKLIRRISGSSSERGGLFQGNLGPLRALIICAQTDGIVNHGELHRGKIDLAKLSYIKLECDRVSQRLCRVDPTHGRRWFEKGNIHRLGAGGDPLTRNSLLDKLADGPWDVIHFAGHSYFRAPERDGELGSGYLFIGSPARPEMIKFSLLAGFLRTARFVYLSSCESGNSSFAVEATDNGINSVIGYKWKVEDSAAALQARLFYGELMRCRSVETAFWNARRRIYRRYRQDQDAWASAMLVTPENC
jgi:CheY-like chemotaxis protein